MNDEMENNFNLKEAIIKVIAFFDMFYYPLTLNEILRNISVKCELTEVMEALEKMEKSPLPPFVKGGEGGFYFLSGRSAIVAERHRRYNFTGRKFKRALLVAKIFKFIPWIKMIAVSNLLGAHNLKNDSDIDFFIIAEDKKIWLTRWFCAGIAKLLGLRPQANNSRDKICLSFYVSERAMDLRGLMIKSPLPPFAKGGNTENPPYPPLLKGAESDDIYFTYWLAGLTPLYDTDGTYEKLIDANRWLYDNLPNWEPVNPARRRLIKPFSRQHYHEVVDLFFGGLEPQFKKFQLRLLPLELRNLMNLDSRVVINDQIIKLHANDRREEYKNRYLDKIRQLRQ